MKTIFFALTTLVIFVGCKSNNKASLETNKNMVLVDTTGLSKASILTDTGSRTNHLKNGVTSTTSSTTTTTTTTTTTNGSVKPVTHASQTKSGNSHINTGSANSNNSSANNSTTSTAPQRDKGWSDAAKGTAIGAGSGAVLGAVLDKNNRAQGAVIGSAVGAGAGYIIGRHRDKKSGRVARSRARRRATH